MTKPLPQRDVEARTYVGASRLSTIDRRALASIADPATRRVIGELMGKSRENQENFEEIEQWFPVQPSDFTGISGIPFHQAVWCEVEGEKGEIIRGGDGMVVQRIAKGVYRVLVEEGVGFTTPADFVNVVAQTGIHESELQAVAADVEPVTVEGIGSGWEVRLFRNVAESDPIDSDFYLFGGNFVDAEGNTIIGPRGPAGPTHKSLWNGTGAPPVELGEEDDFYIDTENFLFYGPKTEEGWGEGSSLVGPEGPQGATGEPGKDGEDGTDGTNGAEGKPGLTWEGPWSAGTAYQVGDAVEQKGSAYIAIKENLNVEPPSSEYWDVLAEGGSGGSEGAEFEEGKAVKWEGLSKGGGTHISEEVLGEKSGEGLHRLRMRARASNGNITEFRLQADDAVVEKNYEARFIIGPLQKLFLNLVGESDFIQLGTTGKITDYGKVEALPEKPSKGDRCTFKAAAGVYWHLEYTGEETYPWAKIGGPPLHSSVANLENKTNAAESTVGAPSITAPLAMEFGGMFGAKWLQQVEATVGTMLIRIRVNGVAKQEVAAIGASTFSTLPSMVTINPVLTAAKGQAIGLGYAVTAGKMTAAAANFVVDPTRVG